jgi:hypothetical protein
MKTANIKVCVHPCFEGLIVANDACKPHNCSYDVKSLSELTIDTKQMELLADGSDGKKTYLDVANSAINNGWKQAVKHVKYSLLASNKFSIKNELFHDLLCDIPEIDDCVPITPSGQIGGRVHFYKNTKSACNTVMSIIVYKLNAGIGNFTLSIKDGGEVTQFILPLKPGQNKVTLNDGKGYKMKSNTIDICFDENSDLIIGSFENCLQTTGGCCGNAPTVANGYKQEFFTYQGLTTGGYDSVVCPQIGGVIPMMKSECKIEDFLCCYKNELCDIVMEQVEIYLLTESLSSNCGFHAFNSLDKEWVKEKIKMAALRMEKCIELLCTSITNNIASKHDACLNCESTFSHGVQVR